MGMKAAKKFGAFAVCLVLGARMLFVRWMPVDVLPSSKGHSSRRSQRVPEPAIDPMNAGRLKVLILRGEMRCRPIDLCTEYWRRYIIVNNVDEVYIVTPRNVSGKPILLYHGEAWGEPRDPHYALGPCDKDDQKTCIYDLDYMPLGEVKEAELRKMMGPRLKGIIIVDNDEEHTTRIRAVTKSLAGRFPDFRPTAERQWAQHLQPNLVLDRYFKNRPEAKTALFAICRQDLLMFKVDDVTPRDHRCLRMIPKPETFQCMLDDANFTVDVFTGVNAVNRRSSDFIMMFDYETFKHYGTFAANYGRYACFGNSVDCVRCGMQSSPSGDYRISEHQFNRWERMVVPYVEAHAGLFKYMFARPNAFAPAYMLRRPIKGPPILCNVDPSHHDCCGARLGLNALPRQHDNRSLSVPDHVAQALIKRAAAVAL